MREEAILEDGHVVLTIHEAVYSRLRRRWRSRCTIEFRSRLHWLDENDQPADGEFASGEIVREFHSGWGAPQFGRMEVRLAATSSQLFEMLPVPLTIYDS